MRNLMDSPVIRLDEDLAGRAVVQPCLLSTLAGEITAATYAAIEGMREPERSLVWACGIEAAAALECYRAEIERKGDHVEQWR